MLIPLCVPHFDAIPESVPSCNAPHFSKDCCVFPVKMRHIGKNRGTFGKKRRNTIDSIVKGLETGLINTFPADSLRCAVDNIVDSFHGCF